MRPSPTRLRALILAALSAVLLVVLSQGAALAQGSTPSALRRVDVTLLDTPDIQQPLLLISGELPASTPLPAEVAIPIPPKSQVSWAGEILGGPTAQDPQAQPRIESKAGYDLAIFTLKQARTGQVEVSAPAMARVTGRTRTVTLSWVSAAAVPDVKLIVRVASTGKVTKPPTGVTRTVGSDGTVQYARSFRSVKPGQKLSLQLGYTPGAAPPSGATPQQTPGALTGSAPRSSAPPAWVLYAIAAIVVGVVYVFLSRRTARTEELEPEPEPADVKRPAAKRPAAKRPVATRQSATSADRGKSQGKGKPKGNGQNGGRPGTPKAPARKAPKAPATSRAKAPAQPPEPEPEPEAGLLGDIFDD